MRLIVLVMGMVLIAGSALAQGRWETTTSGCKVWSDHPRELVSVTWSRKCKKGRVSGKGGILLWSYLEDGKLATLRYEGDMLLGDMDGRGELVWPNGDRYEGEFDDGFKHGEGTYVWASGNRYKGEFLKGAI